MKNICPNCRTENEEEYLFCKNCGTPLTAEEKPAEGDEKSDFEQGFKGNYYTYSGTNSSQSYPDTIGGIQTPDVSLFVGKKADKILPHLAKMEVTGTKVSWNWPLFLLSFFFGPFGAAIYFFYRKMYKWGGIFAFAGTVLLFATTFITAMYGTPILMPRELLAGYDYAAAQSPIYYSYPPAEYINYACNVIIAVLCGLFGYHFYLQKICKSISKYRQSGADMRYYRFALSAIGGTSGGMCALMVFIYGVLIWCVDFGVEFLVGFIK